MRDRHKAADLMLVMLVMCVGAGSVLLIPMQGKLVCRLNIRITGANENGWVRLL